MQPLAGRLPYRRRVNGIVESEDDAAEQPLAEQQLNDRGGGEELHGEAEEGLIARADACGGG